jgi:hypothetical protein
MLPIQFVIVLLIGPGLGTLGALLGRRVARRQVRAAPGGAGVQAGAGHGGERRRRVHAFNVGVWTEVDWYHVGVGVLFLAALLAAATMKFRVLHGLRDRDAWVWFWLVCTFCLGINVVLWAVARIAALLRVIATLRMEGERLLTAVADDRGRG